MRWLFAKLGLALMVFAAPVSAAPIEKAYFAGYTFISDNVDVGVRFPLSYQISEKTSDNGQNVLQAELSKRLRENMPESFELDFNQSNEPGAITLAFALDWENVSVVHIGDIYKVVIDLHAQILVFDFSEKKVIAAYPVAVQLRDGAKEKPTEAYLEQRVREMYLTNKHDINIFDEFTARLKDLVIKEKYRNYIQLVKVSLTDRAAKKVAEISPLSESAFKGFVGQHFTKFLSVNQDVAVLPFAKGGKVEKLMAARFADGSVFNFKLPEPDYEMEIEYTGFGKKQLDKNEVWEAWMYVTGYNLKVTEPLSGRQYLSGAFRDNVVAKQVANETKADDWSMYQEAFFSLSTNLTKQISERSSDWLSKRTKTKDVVGQLEVFEGILERCR